MKVLLLNVPLRPESSLIQFPIGLAFIASAIKRAGFDLDILNIDGLRLSDEAVERHLRAHAYDVVCLGVMVTGYSKVKAITRLIRQVQPKTTIVVGNTVATSIPEILLTRTDADIAVMGEGDETIVDLLAALANGRSLDEVPGICHRDGQRLAMTPPRPTIKDISAIPMIDYSLWDMEIYLANSPRWVHEPCPIPRHEVRGMQVNTARGCVGNCTFCYHNFKGAPYRHRSDQVIIDEIAWLQTNYDLNFCMFWDDLTFHSRAQAERFAQAILDRGLKFHWIAHCRADLLNNEEDLAIAKLMHQAGCYAMNFSLESADADILKAMRKQITPEQFSRQVDIFRRAGIQPFTSLVFGYPQETPATIAKTIDCCIQNRIYPSSGFFLPQPGSVMYDWARVNGFIPNEEEFLLKMGDRQDFRVNLTSMPDQQYQSLVLDGLARINQTLKIGLDQRALLKTTTYRPAKTSPQGPNESSRPTEWPGAMP